MDSNSKNVELDESTLLVSGKKTGATELKKLANAICTVIEKHDVVKLRCVGAAAVNNGVKAFIIAKGFLDNNEEGFVGSDILMNADFTEVSFGDEKRTAIVLTVETILE